MYKLTKSSNNLIQGKMEIILKKPLWFTVVTTLCLVIVILLAAIGCDKSENPSKNSNNVSFTPCQQKTLRSSSDFSEKIDLEFTSKGVQITYHDFEVTCDFTTVNVTHTFVNGVLNITQRGTPNQANCICYTDVSYTIDGISQDKVNVIFINDVQVYCYNVNMNSLIGTWREIVPCKDCSSLTFSDNDTIYHQFTYDNSIVKLTYKFISEDSIQIERLQESETNPYTRKTNNRIIFYNSDSMLIEKFYVSDAAVFPPEFIDIKLLKTR